MIKKIFRELVWVIGILMFGIFQITVIQGTPLHYQVVNLIVLSTIFLLVIRLPIRALLVASIGGYILDLYSPLQFGVVLTALLFSLGVILFIQKNILKSVAMHSAVILTLVGNTLYHSIFFIIFRILQQLQMSDSVIITTQSYLLFTFIQTIGHTVIITLFFMLQSIFRKRFLRTSP